MGLAAAYAPMLVGLQSHRHNQAQLVLRWEDSHHGFAVGRACNPRTVVDSSGEVACHGGCRDSHRATPRCPKTTRPKERGVSRGGVYDSTDDVYATIGVVAVLPLLAVAVGPVLARVLCDEKRNVGSVQAAFGGGCRVSVVAVARARPSRKVPSRLRTPDLFRRRTRDAGD